MKRLLYALPLLVSIILGGYFAKGLSIDPRSLPDMLVGAPAPAFSLEPLNGYDRGFSDADLKGRVSLVNVFGSWCAACRFEHPFLMELKVRGDVPIFGINWRERNIEAGPLWLRRMGNPYDLIGSDPQSRAAIAFGVSGAPETFIVDRAGYVRFKHTGPLTKESWEQTLWPLIQKLRRS